MFTLFAKALPGTTTMSKCTHMHEPWLCYGQMQYTDHTHTHTPMHHQTWVSVCALLRSCCTHSQNIEAKWGSCTGMAPGAGGGVASPAFFKHGIHAVGAVLRACQPQSLPYNTSNLADHSALVTGVLTQNYTCVCTHTYSDQSVHQLRGPSTVLSSPGSAHSHTVKGTYPARDRNREIERERESERCPRDQESERQRARERERERDGGTRTHTLTHLQEVDVLVWNFCIRKTLPHGHCRPVRPYACRNMAANDINVQKDTLANCMWP